MRTIKRLAGSQLAAAGQADWERVCATSEAEIVEAIASDADTAPDLGDTGGWRVVRRPAVPDVRRIRAKMGLSQAAFAERFGLRVRTVQEWEQGRAVPDQPARVLLRVIEAAPETVETAARALRAS